MAGGNNLASKYSKTVDERFYKESQAVMALNSDYEFTGVRTVKVYSLPTVPMVDYQRSGLNRYGTPSDLARNVQELTVTRDRAFTFIIDRGDKIQSQMVSDADKALARQIREVWVPEYDSYVFKTLAAAATARGNYSTEEITRDNAYEMFLNAQEKLGNHNVPDKGRVCFCTYKFANFLKQDSAFMRYSDTSQDMLVRGVIGEVDGTRIVKVPSSRLPAGAAFLLTHPCAATAPKQLEDFRTHDNPPGISGWLVEGRVTYDCFVLAEKANGVFYHGSQPVLKILNVTTVGTGGGMSQILVEPAALDGVKRYYHTAADNGGLSEVTYGSAITVSEWTELTANGVETAVEEGHDLIRVVEVDESGLPVAVGDAVLNIG